MKYSGVIDALGLADHSERSFGLKRVLRVHTRGVSLAGSTLRRNECGASMAH